MSRHITLGLATLGLGIFLAGTSASAASVSVPELPSLKTDQLVQVQYGPGPNYRRPPPPPPPRWVPGRRYDAPPPNWRRHGSRPHDWRRRGCIIVGPVWFCP